MTGVTGVSDRRANRRLEALVRKESEEKLSNSAHDAITTHLTFQPWTEKYKPVKLDNHFVHKKRVEELAVWLMQKLSKKQPSICLLTGPSGSGKTATISLLAAHNEVIIKEWINPMSLTEFNPNIEFNRDDVQGRSQLDLFSDFLLRSSQYSALPLKGVVTGDRNKKLILVEDFPNTFYRQTALFHQLLRNYAKIGCCPLIFIVADVASSDGNVNKLFPQTLLTEFNIQQFSFNPVAPSYVVKFLSTIVSQESLDVEKGLLDDIAVASSGDIRWAVNHFQFKMQQVKQSFFKRPGPRSKRAISALSKNKTSKVQKLDERDDTLFLFRALGKVLYAKRDISVDAPIESELRNSLFAQRRPHPLLEVPESIGDKMEVSPETFFHFLHHNHTSFFSSMEDLAQASAFLADSALIFSQWIFDDMSARNFKNRDTREELGLSIAIRGLMHSNNERTVSTWKPLRKPMMAEVNTCIQKTTETARFLFSWTSPLIQSFYPEVLPFYSKLLPRNLRPDQVTFLKNVNVWKSGQVNCLYDTILNEKDTVDDEPDTEVVMENLPKEMRLKMKSNNPSKKGDPVTGTNTKSPVIVPIIEEVCSAFTCSIEPQEEFLIEDYDE